MSKIKAGIIGAMALASVAVPLAVHHKAQAALHELEEARRQQSERVAALEAQVLDLSNQAKNSLPKEPPSARSPDAEWSERLLALNKGDWELALATGKELAAVPPESGVAILRAHWNSITNVIARRKLIEAFDSARHERLPAVLELGLLDASPEVQQTLVFELQTVALRDFSTNFEAARDWLRAHRDSTLPQVLTEAAYSATDALRNLRGDSLHNQLDLLGTHANRMLSDYPDLVTASGLDQALGDIARGSDPRAVEQALTVAASLPLNEDWLRENALPRLAAENPLEVRAAAARALGKPGSDWAVGPLIEALSQTVYSSDGCRPVLLAQPLAEIGSPKAIPAMIALIQADNTYDTVYGIGCFGLGRMTGVEYDKHHDGTWWQQWWANNKQRFPADVQALEIPRLEPVKRAPDSSPAGPATR